MDWEKYSKSENHSITFPNSWLHLHYFEALNLLFRIENATRVFVYIILKNQHKDKWLTLQVGNENGSELAISSIAKKRVNQSQDFGYLGYKIESPIMHLTSGELARLITHDKYWRIFKKHFYAKKNIVKNKFEEIATIRNALAHFRPIKADDIDVLKQNSKHILKGMDDLFSHILVLPDVTPTNTSESWYQEIRKLKSDLCTFSANQSKDKIWIKLSLNFSCPTIKSFNTWGNNISYSVLTLRTPEIINKYKKIKDNTVYVTEYIPYTSMPDSLKPDYKKTISFVFSHNNLSANYSKIMEDFVSIIAKIEEECDLIVKDNLARGIFVQTALVSASGEKKDDSEKITYTIYKNNLKTPIRESDPIEYWGDLSFSAWDDFISKTDIYPWMPETISRQTFPF